MATRGLKIPVRSFASMFAFDFALEFALDFALDADLLGT